MTDPLDVLIEASELADPVERVAGYRRAVAAADAASDEHPGWYLASVRARAACGLARDRVVPFDHATREVRHAVDLGERCASTLALAEAAEHLGLHSDAVAAVRALPNSCFRSDLLAVWRFRAWDIRAASSFAMGESAEGFRWSWQLVSRMNREDTREFVWAPPTRTVTALVELSGGTSRDAGRARELLRELVERVELDDWFQPEMVARVRASVEAEAPR